MAKGHFLVTQRTQDDIQQMEERTYLLCQRCKKMDQRLAAYELDWEVLFVVIAVGFLLASANEILDFRATAMATVFVKIIYSRQFKAPGLA